MPFYESVAPLICKFPPVELRLSKVIDGGFVIGDHVNVTAWPQFGVCVVVVKKEVVFGWRSIPIWKVIDAGRVVLKVKVDTVHVTTTLNDCVYCGTVLGYVIDATVNVN